MCSTLTSMVRMIATKQKTMGTNRSASNQLAREKTQSVIVPPGHINLKVKQRTPLAKEKSTKTLKGEKTASPAKTTNKNSLSNNEIHITSDGVKVIDFHPDEAEQCMMNQELKDYELENRHRYIPRNLSQKNVALQGKIDRDIE